jgi:hypothetical protein
LAVAFDEITRKDGTMNKTSALKLLNPVLAVLVLNQPLSIYLHEATHLEAFEFLHLGGGVLLVIGAALHLILNWSWVRLNFFQ